MAKVAPISPEVVVPQDYADWLEDEKAVLWAESAAMAAFYLFLLDEGLPEDLAKTLTTVRFQYHLASSTQSD